MPTATLVTLSTQPSVVGAQALVALAPAAIARPPAAYVSSIVGSLPGNRRLVHPVIVVVEPDDNEVLVSEPHFHMHAAAPTEAEATEAFRHILSGYLDFLSANEDTLGAHLRAQLEYLREIIQPV